MDRLRNFGFLIKDLTRLYTQLFEEHARAYEITLPQCKALAHLAKNEGISQIRLAEITDIDPMTLVRILDRMESDGWIERRAHPTDRRARQLYVKAKAKPVLDQIWKTGDQIRSQAFIGFSAAQRDQLLDLLERAHTNLLDSKTAPAEALDKTKLEKTKLEKSEKPKARLIGAKKSTAVVRNAVRSTR